MVTGKERWRVGPSAWLEESLGSTLSMFTWVFRTPCHLSEYGGNYPSTWAYHEPCHLAEYGGNYPSTWSNRALCYLQNMEVL
jgi:hypothetical protein